MSTSKSGSCTTSKISRIFWRILVMRKPCERRSSRMAFRLSSAKGEPCDGVGKGISHRGYRTVRLGSRISMETWNVEWGIRGCITNRKTTPKTVGRKVVQHSIRIDAGKQFDHLSSDRAKADLFLG